MTTPIVISEEFIFDFQNDIGIDSSRTVLRKYHENFKNAFNLEGNYPIFLDTNILLNYYGMSKENKTKLKTFFEDKIGRIHLTQQIEKEFQRNRESAISDYFSTLNEIRTNYETDLQKGVKSKFKNLLESKIVEQDFPDIMDAIKKIYEELDVKLFSNDSLLNKVAENVKSSIDESKDLLFIDPILDVYSKFQRIPDLSATELEFLIKKYQEYLPLYKDAKETLQARLTFPGCGETKNTEKHGDFVIFHEILKYMKVNSSDAILLTRDVTKSDWLKKDRKPFIHYILKAFQMTDKTLYIFDATDLLQRISFDNIYKTDNSVTQNVHDDVDEYDEDDSTGFYRTRFLNIVLNVKEYFEKNSEDFSDFSLINDRSLLEQDLDIIALRKSGEKSGFLVYQCGSTKKGFQKNIQKRINSCDKFIDSNLADEAILCIVLTKKAYLSRLDRRMLESKSKIRIVIFFSKNLNDPTLELLSDFQV